MVKYLVVAGIVAVVNAVLEVSNDGRNIQAGKQSLRLAELHLLCGFRVESVVLLYTRPSATMTGPLHR